VNPSARRKPCGTRPDKEVVCPGTRKKKPLPSFDPRV
jgi:hypothetical protein